MAKKAKKAKSQSKSRTCFGAVPSTRKYKGIKGKVPCRGKRQTVSGYTLCPPNKAAGHGRCKPGVKGKRVASYTRCVPKPGKSVGQKRGRRKCSSYLAK